MFQLISTYSDWFDEMKNKRDPIAHRKPLYVPLGIVASEEEVQKLNDIDKKIKFEKDTNKLFELHLERESTVEFYPYMLQNDHTKLDDIEETILKDLQILCELNRTIFDIM